MQRPRLSSYTPFAAIAAGLSLAWLAVPKSADVSARVASGDITGEVRFAGIAPKPRVIDRSTEPVCQNGTALDESALIIDKKLANVHVGAVSGTMGKHRPPKKPVIVQQSDCLYVPRVQGAQEGQKILVTNGDPTMHNVHARRGPATWLNRSQPAKSEALEVDSGDAGEVIKLGCDVHRWMRAHIPVTDHPYFDVTGRDGKFVITGVPIGKKIKLRAWHEKYGEQVKEVNAGDDVIFTFIP